MPDLPTGPITFLCTDIAGSTARRDVHRSALRSCQLPLAAGCTRVTSSADPVCDRPSNSTPPLQNIRTHQV